MDRYNPHRRPVVGDSNGCCADGFFDVTARFRLDGCLGAGGMGVVYRAFDRRWQRYVALKSGYRGSRDALHLPRAFRAMADLRHPNLVRLFELHRHGPERFFTMELVDGCNFATYVRFGPRPGELADLETTPCDGEEQDSGFQLSYADFGGDPLFLPHQFHRLRRGLTQLAAGLNAMHDAGRLHRDVKPSNVLVTPDGRVVLVDFGSASGLSESELFEAAPCGTPPYMSPEQSAREPLSPASDWYAFGVTLYELLTGHLPFSGTAKEMLAAKRAPVAPPENLAAPNDLVDLCARLLRCEPGQRPSGSEVLAVCERGC